MANIVLTTPTSEAPVDLVVASASSGGDYFVNSGRIILYFKNTSGVQRTITIVSNGTLETGLTIGDITFTIEDGEEKITRTFPTRYFNDSNGRVNITYSDETGLEVAAIKVNY